ncbi:MAG: hypothetical protein LBG91_04605 [Treponema sp.]|jgi:4-hydroxy-2-oxoheptanedioate aldolase|nr:hypothetical protein [Treponema sp.]
MQNRLKAKLLNGEKAVGTMSQLGCQAAVECLGIAGLDFFIIDMEHTAIGPENMRSLIVASEKYRITPLVRIPVITRDAVLKALDSGAGGLIVPAIETAEQVRELIRFAKYPNDGVRGFSMTRAASYGYDEIARDPNKYFRHFNEETLVIPQCETRGCLDNIEEIAAVQGVDGIFIGPFDLSAALGCPADFENAGFQCAVKRVLNVCRTQNKFVFMLSGSPEQAASLFAEGFSGVVFGLDINILIDAYRAAAETLNAAPHVRKVNVSNQIAQIGQIVQTTLPETEPPEKCGDCFAEYLAQLGG